jgi:hypothetical protein
MLPSPRSQRKLEASTWGLAAGLITHLAATPDGAAALLRGGAAGGGPAPVAAGGGGADGLLGATQRLATDVLEAGLPVKQRDVPRLHAALQVCGFALCAP